MIPMPLQKRFDSSWPWVDIRAYISPQLFSISSPSICKVEPWFIGKRLTDPVVWYCPVKGSGTPSSSSELVLETNVRFLNRNMAVDCLTMEPLPDSSFGNWMSKLCNKLLCDFGQWVKSDVLYKPSEIALIKGCGLLWTTTIWQSLLSTSFPIPFSNPPCGRHQTIEPIGNILGHSYR